MSQSDSSIPQQTPRETVEAEQALLALLALFPLHHDDYFVIQPPAAGDSEPNQWLVQICSVYDDITDSALASAVRQSLADALYDAHSEYMEIADV